MCLQRITTTHAEPLQEEIVAYKLFDTSTVSNSDYYSFYLKEIFRFNQWSKDPRGINKIYGQKWTLWLFLSTRFSRI